jgi:hypothetical protein
MRDFIYKEQCSVIVDLKRRGDGAGSGYTCHVMKDGVEIFHVTPSGESPESCFNTIMSMWNYYMGNY